MKRRTYFALGLVALALVGLAARQTASTTAKQPREKKKPAAQPPVARLPITQVHLFSSGVGYFQREGVVDGNVRVEFSFPATDINDLLKSLVLKDSAGGRIGAINYNSQEPIERTLRSFALDLTNNPSFGQILNQGRGENVQVTLRPADGKARPALTGKIVGMQSQWQGAGKDRMIEIERLNVLCADGLRSVPLDQIQRVKFLQPALDSEFRRALDVLASAHDTQKKKVLLGFNGTGKRRVRVGYVVENPIWKTSYRLVAVKLVNGVLHAAHQLREARTYDVKNRSAHERLLIIEHPIRPGWQLVTPAKAAETSRNYYRFVVTVPAGKSVQVTVVEEQSRVNLVELRSSDEDTLRLFMTSRVAGPRVRKSLQKAINIKARLTSMSRDLGQFQARLKAAVDDRTRVRTNLEKLTQTSASYKRFLDKIDAQETDIEKLQKQIKETQKAVKQQQKEYEDYVMALHIG